MIRMDKTSPGQIDRRIAASFGAVVLLLGLTTAWVASHLYLSLQVQEENRLAGAITTILSEAINRVAFSGKHHSRLLVEDMLARVPELAYISVETEDGRVLAHSNPGLNDSSVLGEDRNNAIKSLKTGQSVLSEHKTANGVIKEIVVPYRGGFDAQTVGTVRVGVQVEATRLAQQTTLYKLLGLVAALTALAIAAVYFLSRRFGGSMRVLGWQLQGILGHAPLGVAICDNRSRLLAHSAELGKMAGQPDENATLESVLSRAFPEASAALSMLQRQVFSGALKVEREVSFETNGIPRSWHISMFPIARDDADRPLLICTLIHDISERKQAEEALRASENQFKTLFSQSPISNLIHDKDSGEIIDANTAAFASYGYSSVEELKAGNFWLERPYSLDDALTWIRKAAAQGPQRFEWLSRRVTGELFWEHVHLSPVVINGVERILASGIDITERKRLELRLADQLAFQQALMDTIPYAVFYKDAETRFMGCNIAYEETFGIKREDFIGKSVLDLGYLPEQDRLAYQTEDEATIAAVGRVHKEMSIPFADGLHHQTLYSVSGFRQADGSPGGLIGVIVDISDLKHAEMALRESEAHYRSVIENIQDMYYRTDRDGRLVLLSLSTPKQLGYETVEEVLGRPASDFYFDPADRQALLSRIREEGAVKDYEVLLKTREGHPMMVSTTSAYYRDANGNVMGVEGIFRDITERKRMESALRASEEKYRTIFDNAPVGIFRTTFAGKFIEANATLARMIGYDSSAELIRNVQDVGDDLYYEPRFKTMLREALLSNPSHAGQEVEFKRRDGSRFYAFINASLQFDENGQPTFLDGTIEDINERKRSEEALRASEARFRAFMDNLPSYVVIKDAESRSLYFNQRFIDTFSGRDWLGKMPEEMLPVDVAEHVKEADLKALADGFVIYTEERRDRQGQRRLLETRKFRIPQENSQNLIGTIITDITEQRYNEEKYRVIFHESTDAIFLVKDNRIVDCNPRTLTIFNCPMERMTGHSPGEFSPQLQPDGSQSSLLAVEKIERAKQGFPQTFEWQHQGCDGRIFTAEVTLTAMDLFSEEYVVAFLRDISERKEMQELMVQTEKMMSVGGLAAGMAHELNNPLGIILQSVQSMERRLSPSLPGNQTVARELTLNLDVLGEYMRARGIDDYLHGIREAGERAARIIRAMLDFSRSSQSMRSGCQVHDMLDTALGLASNDYDLKKKYDFKSISIERDYDLSADRVECTETEIVQVLLNIIKNAAQAMPSRGDRPEPPTLRLRTRRLDDSVRIEISDNGPGMDEILRRRVFEPFFTTKPQGEGTGLGLSVAYFIITHKHRGKIAVESTPGLGTTFVIELPLE